jgi:hypothetical protein
LQEATRGGVQNDSAEQTGHDQEKQRQQTHKDAHRFGQDGESRRHPNEYNHHTNQTDHRHTQTG